MFSIGDLSRRTGVKIPTIRYYEGIGLLDPPERSCGNQRRYTQDGLERLSFIRHSRQLGLTLLDIRELILLGNVPEQSCEKAHEIAHRHQVTIRTRIAQLQRLEVELARITKSCDAGHIGECNIIHTLADHRQCLGDH